ncbi:MAG: HD domain-containing phosphohydrolase [Candidatus Saccharicenans sp.]|uniref:HD domain-containing phosphohydrolase n=1 Tax=Candidatus Saccharicenans sp. TaxID=2819258 RepID=UPI0040497721
MTADDIKNNSQEIIKAIIDNTRESIYVVSSRGFEFVNPAFEALTGYSEKEILSSSFNFLQLVHPEDRHLFSARKTPLARPNLPSDSGLIEFRLITRSGELKYVEASTSKLKENPDQTLTILRDITTRKRAEDQLTQTLDKLRKTMSATIQAISLTVESRDPYTAGHQRRVSDLARSIATKLCFPNEQIDEIRLAALVHDLGKISVPAEILNKPGRLNEHEFNLIKDHPRVGYEIIKTIEFPWPVAEIIYQHHERLDGSGYPLGLKDGQIHPMARILAVADVVEAMLSHRPYRSAFGPQEVIQEISVNRGLTYDPPAVDACIELLREKYQLAKI